MALPSDKDFEKLSEGPKQKSKASFLTVAKNTEDKSQHKVLIKEKKNLP